MYDISWVISSWIQYLKFVTLRKLPENNLEMSKRVLQENKARQIFQKTNISNPLIRSRVCLYQGVKNSSFSENLACFVFLYHPF